MTVDMIVGSSNISSNVEKIDIWAKATEGVGRFLAQVNNQNGQYNTLLNTPDAAVTISYKAVELLKGYLDIVKPTAESLPQAKILQTMILTGRDVGQDLQNKTTMKPYGKKRADDLIAQMLIDAEAEITFTSPSTAPELVYESKGDLLVDSFRDIMAIANYDYRIKNDKTLEMFSTGSISSGITLKAVADAIDNNILSLRRDLSDALEVRNYIFVRGKELSDGWTEGNADGWIGETGNTVADEYAQVKVGAGAIKVTKGTGANLGLKLTFPRYNYDFLDFSKTPNAQLSFHCFISATASEFRMPQVRLTDTDGNVIRFFPSRQAYNEIWFQISVPIGYDAKVGATEFWGTNYDSWRYVTGSSFNWKIKEIQIISPDPYSAYLTYMVIDGMQLPKAMIGLAQDLTSQGLYKVRKLVVSKTDIESQKELDSYASALLDAKKEVIKRLVVEAVGEAGFIEGVNKWIPGYSLILNVPSEGINNVAYRIFEVHHIISKEPLKEGWNYIVEVSLVPLTEKIDSLRWKFGQDPTVGLLQGLRGELISIQRKDEYAPDYYPGMPKPLWELYGKIPLDGLNLELPESLVLNGDFEIDFNNDGIPDLWVWNQHAGSGASKGTSAGFSGAKSVYTTLLAGNVTYQAASWYSDYFPVVAGDNYYGCSWVKGTGGTAKLRILWFNKDADRSKRPYDSANLIGYADPWSGTPSSSWGFKYGKVTAPANAAFAIFECFYENTSGSTVTVYFDRAQFKTRLTTATLAPGVSAEASEELSTVVETIEITDITDVSDSAYTSSATFVDLKTYNFAPAPVGGDWESTIVTVKFFITLHCYSGQVGTFYPNGEIRVLEDGVQKGLVSHGFEASNPTTCSSNTSAQKVVSWSTTKTSSTIKLQGRMTAEAALYEVRVTAAIYVIHKHRYKKYGVPIPI